MNMQTVQRLMVATLLTGLGAGCQTSSPSAPATEVTSEAQQEFAFLISCPPGRPHAART
ncbi:MAG: hypothetical protein ABI193_09585 [Minicystis sp.]